MFSQKKHKTAFSLIELSIVLVIISILIAAALSASLTAINNAKTKTTNDRLKEVYKAMGQFLVKNGRLPCPGNITALKTAAAYGKEIGGDASCVGTGVYTSVVVGATNLVYGMVPVSALGLANDMAEDAWGNKFSYVIDKNYTVSSKSSSGIGAATFGTIYVTYSAAAALTYPSSSIITISNVTDTTSHAATSNAIFVLLSHGGNGYGAYSASASAPNSRANSDTNEQSNDNGGSPYTSFDATFSATAPNATFDDIVFFADRNQIVQDFAAFLAIPCGTIGVTSLYGTTITWPQGQYDQLVTATTECPSGYRNGATYPARKCGALGVWDSAVAIPCAT